MLGAELEQPRRPTSTTKKEKGKLRKTSNLDQAHLLAHCSVKTSYTNIPCGQSSCCPGAEGEIWAALYGLGAGGLFCAQIPRESGVRAAGA